MIKCLFNKLKTAIQSTFVLAAALAAIPFYTSVSAANTNEGPALWKLTDHDSEIWLFGTIHILKPGMDWHSAKLSNAFDKAETVYFEAPVEQENIKPLVMKHGISPMNPLSQQMTAEGKEHLAKAISAFGLPNNFSRQLDPMRPWLAAVTMAAIQVQASGGNPESGVDRVLSGRAKAMNKKLAYLESDEQQILFLANLSQAAQLYFLEDGLRLMLQDPNMIDTLIEAWRTGDVVSVDKIMLESMEGHDELYQTLLVKRNINWAQQIKKLMAGSGTTFIAVGAAHLAGEHSVQKYLLQHGLISTRQ